EPLLKFIRGERPVLGAGDRLGVPQTAVLAPPARVAEVTLSAHIAVRRTREWVRASLRAASGGISPAQTTQFLDAVVLLDTDDRLVESWSGFLLRRLRMPDHLAGIRAAVQ